MAFLHGAGDRIPPSWVVWIRPSRKGAVLARLTYRDIERQLHLALQRLASMGRP